ncbi:hypothetical protein LP419_02870 [Massilia sp. H-1]|nr:hypothetical protein LP419_02870 [Massilia sp. H-1]
MEASLAWSWIAALAQALQPFSALPPGPAAHPLPPVDTGGARIVAEGLRGAPVSGAAGPTQYVQVANATMAVYDKASGTLSALGLAPGGAVRRRLARARDAGLRRARRGTGLGLVRPYRAALGAGLAGRHRRLSVPGRVGSSPNAAGRFHVHALRLQSPGTGHPQIALWRDALLLSFDLGGRATRMCAIDSAALTSRYPAMRCRDIARGGVAAASLAPQAVLPAGTPALLLALDASDSGSGNTISLWRYAPADNTLSGPLAVPVARCAIACAACIAQPPGGAPLASHARQLAPRAVRWPRAGVQSHGRAAGRPDRDSLVRAARAVRRGPDLPARHVRAGRRAALDGQHRHRQGRSDIALAYAVASEATAA